MVAEIDANMLVTEDVDIVLYDFFAQPEADHDQIKVLVDNPHARRVGCTCGTSSRVIDSAMAKGPAVICRRR